MEQQQQQQQQRDRSSTPDSDASTISCPSPLGERLATPSPNSSQSSAAVVPNEQQASLELASVQDELQTVLEYVDHGMILKSFDTLSRLTDIVVTNCERLGLVSDDGSRQATDQRIGFWTGLNNCWLFAFSHFTNSRSEDQQLREHHLHHLHNSVRLWADRLEKYGLVNYELGLWEQDILEAIEVCLVSTVVFRLPSTATTAGFVGTKVRGEQDQGQDQEEG